MLGRVMQTRNVQPYRALPQLIFFFLTLVVPVNSVDGVPVLSRSAYDIFILNFFSIRLCMSR